MEWWNPAKLVFLIQSYHNQLLFRSRNIIAIFLRIKSFLKRMSPTLPCPSSQLRSKMVIYSNKFHFLRSLRSLWLQPITITNWTSTITTGRRTIMAGREGATKGLVHTTYSWQETIDSPVTTNQEPGLHVSQLSKDRTRMALLISHLISLITLTQLTWSKSSVPKATIIACSCTMPNARTLTSNFSNPNTSSDSYKNSMRCKKISSS